MDDNVYSTTKTIVQQNIARNQKALDELLKFLVDNTTLKVALIQEPYIRDRTIPMPPNFTALHSRFDDANMSDTRPRAAIIAPSTTPILFLPQHSTRDICVCQTTICNLKVTIVTVYFAPDEDIDRQIATLETTLGNIKSKCVLIGGDFNGHHRAWGSETSRPRGNRLVGNSKTFHVAAVVLEL